MDSNLLNGKLVRLTSEDPEILAKAFSRWGRDSEYIRLLDSEAAILWSVKKFKDWIEKDLGSAQPNDFFFSIRTLEGDLLIGFIGLFGIQWSHGDTWVGIGIGEREYWGKGYGTDAMHVILRYAFLELNLHRVSLGVFGYNKRAIRSYEKAGFKLEGCLRGSLHRDGRRWDMFNMGILRKEWDQLQAQGLNPVFKGKRLPEGELVHGN
jgi:RimJ/RimL family protein N-acetyltransferase